MYLVSVDAMDQSFDSNNYNHAQLHLPVLPGNEYAFKTILCKNVLDVAFEPLHLIKLN